MDKDWWEIIYQLEFLNYMSEERHSFCIEYKEEYASKEVYQKVLERIVANVKVGPFLASSGIILPYYLSASTNFLDKHTAPYTVQIYKDYLLNVVRPMFKLEKILIIGMEMAGGILVSQFASLNDQKLNEWADFCYCRKAQKETGTRQQLEGPNEFTSRTSKSEPINAIWVDDALSTGESLYQGVEILSQKYNINIICALYLCDRSRDRINLQKKYLTEEFTKNCKIVAIYDLEEVDVLFKKVKK